MPTLNYSDIPVVPTGLDDDQMELFLKLAREAFAIIKAANSQPPAQGLRFAHNDQDQGTMATSDGQELPTA